MAWHPSARDNENAINLYDYATDKPDGFTNVEAMDHFEWDLDTFNKTVRTLRLIFADDEINLPCKQETHSSPWVYRLTARYEDSLPWVANRLTDTEARLETQVAMYHSLVNATDGRTIEGRKARLLHKTFTRLLEDLRELAGNDAA